MPLDKPTEETDEGKSTSEVEDKTVVTETDPPPEGMQVAADGKTVQVLSSSAYKKLKDEAREKGKKEALTELARRSGFATIEEMEQAAVSGKQATARARAAAAAEEADPTPPKPIAAADPGAAPKHLSDKAQAAWNKERDRILAENQQLRQKADMAERRNKVYAKKIEDVEAEKALQAIAFQAGIKDPDYAVTLHRRHIEKASEEQLKAFESDKFFSGLRTSHPYLFGETVIPATTGTVGGDGKPGAPGAIVVTEKTGAAGQIDARKMTPAELEAHLRKRGINPHLS